MHLKKILTLSFFAVAFLLAANVAPALAESNTYSSNSQLPENVKKILSSTGDDIAKWEAIIKQAQDRIKQLKAKSDGKTPGKLYPTYGDDAKKVEPKTYPTYGDDAKKVEPKTYPTYGDDAKKVDYKGYPADATAILKKVQERIEWIKSQKPGSSGTFTLPPNTEGKPKHSDPIPLPVDKNPKHSDPIPKPLNKDPKHSDPLPPYIGTSTPKHSDPLPPYIPGTGGPAAKNLLFDARSKESTQAFFDSIRLRIEKLKAEANN